MEGKTVFLEQNIGSHKQLVNACFFTLELGWDLPLKTPITISAVLPSD